MSTTSGWTANMRSRLSHQNHFASIQTARDSLTPPTQTRSSTHLSGIVPKSVCSQATSVACSTKTCPTASPTSPATLSLPTLQWHQKPQWWRNVSSPIMCANPVIFNKQKTWWRLLNLHDFSDCSAPPSLLSMECPVTKLQWPSADLDDTFHAAGNSLAVNKASNCCIP